jgi:A/G-specific adenine glycosylase
MTTHDFARRLIAWQKRHGRHHLPWQNTRDPYRIWLSEIMLQQTQVSAVIPYFERFIQRFPTLAALAAAKEDDVLAHWSGLGYYARARNLQRAARMIVETAAGDFPREFDAILALPGIGRSTAAAISVFAFGARCTILDGNVKRVLARYCGIEGDPGDKQVEALLWNKANTLVPGRGIEAYTQGLMDLGAGVCSRARPRCDSCPVSEACVARRENRVHELPARRVRRAVPEKTTVMLIIADRAEILLEKRPSSGIWGALWSFPEITPGSDAVGFCKRELGLEVRLAPPWPAMDHGFTHFRLKITPQPVVVVRRLPLAAQTSRLWLNCEDALGAAVPQPVKTLLRMLNANENGS